MNDTKTQACQWKYCESECSWDTQCDNKYQFMNDGPKENDYKFCPGCGKPVTLAGAERVELRHPEYMSNENQKSEAINEDAQSGLSSATLLDGCPVCGLPVTPHVTKDCCIEALKEALDKATRRFDERYGCECDVCHVLKPLRDLKYVERKMVCIACLHPSNDGR